MTKVVYTLTACLFIWFNSMNSIWLNQLTQPTHAAAVCDMFETVTSFLWCRWLQWAWHRYSHLSRVQVNACNEAGSGTASLELSSVNHLLACMDSCSVNGADLVWTCSSMTVMTSMFTMRQSKAKKSHSCLFLMGKACEESMSHCVSCLIEVSVLWMYLIQSHGRDYSY